MNKFIVGKSRVTNDVGLLNTLLFEVFEDNPRPWVSYEVDSGVVVIEARGRDQAEVIQLPAKQGVHRLHLVEEPDGLSLDVVESTLMKLLGTAACGGLPILSSEQEARKKLTDLPYDVGYERSLSSREIPMLPAGLGLAVCHQEFLGATVLIGLRGKPATQWGIMLYNFRRTMVLFKE